jgi:hypothetical protein
MLPQQERIMTELSPEMQSIVDYVNGDDEPLTPMPTPASASAEAAAARRAEAARKREERARVRKSGVPPARAVDAAIAGALASVLVHDGAVEALRDGGKKSKHAIDLIPVLRHAVRSLVARGFDRDAVPRVVRVRLFG